MLDLAAVRTYAPKRLSTRRVVLSTRLLTFAWSKNIDLTTIPTCILALLDLLDHFRQHRPHVGEPCDLAVDPRLRFLR